MEINVHTPSINTAKLSHIKFDERAAAAVYKILMALGATKDMRLFVDPHNTCYVMVKFFYSTDPVTGEKLYGDQRMELEEYIMKLVKGHKLKMSRLNKIKGAFNRIENALITLKKELS